MKIVLVNPRAKETGSVQQKCFAPVSLLYLAASLIQNGYEVEVIDANALGLSNEEVAQQVKRCEPGLIGIAILSEIFLSVYSLSKKIRQVCPTVPLVIGGPHANALPEAILEEFKDIDYLLQGEAEESIVQLCQAIEKKRSIDQVQGLYYRSNGAIVSNTKVCPVLNLDRLKHPVRNLLADLYQQKKYYLVITRQRPVDSIVTSRGCPFRCRFCSNVTSDYRARSPDNVLEEITALYNRGIRSIDIADAHFTLDRERAMRILNLLIKEKFSLALRLKSRSDAIDEELVKKAKQAGVYLITLGMESGSQKILNFMRKDTTIERNVAACALVRKHGIKLNTGWIIGFPGETPDTIRETISVLLKIRPTTANINLLVPYPGTEVYERAKAERTLQRDWSVSDGAIPWVKLPWINSYAELQRIVQWARHKIYYRPHYLASFAKEIVVNANLLLARYALQEFHKSLRKTRKEVI